VAIVGATIWDRNGVPKERVNTIRRTIGYTGCGHAVRLSAYRKIRGYLPRPVAYGMEETDVALQLFSSGWQIYESGELRVFHDTSLAHHNSPHITAGTITNLGLFVFLNYPIVLWSWGLLQFANLFVSFVRVGRTRGLLIGILRIPNECYRNRKYRRAAKLMTIVEFLHLRRNGFRG
jgi:hypothetical protein